ncbi:hypothetical protein KIL84_018620 [Mauremys mutica]|uniref:Uncharacterized protein n=1 Tax=Mauremys mutica TaxID=74926 RepID=A0A9D3XUR5_9SAUR|nr:hypothetical protein KIL84_018620 [Mauremys mutica]
MDILVGLEVVDNGPNCEDEVVDEDVDLEDNVEPTAGSSGGAASQELSTPELSSQFQQSVSSEQDAGEETPALRVPLSQVTAAPLPAATSSLPTTASTTIYSGQGPFLTLTRKHGVHCLLVPASPHVETYVRALVRVVGPTAIVTASKMYGKVIFFLALEATAQEAVEKGLAVGGVFVPL